MALAADQDKLICPDMNLENCYPKHFVPSKEWQIIKPGQIVPEGLHYKMDFETGIQHARILDPSEESAEKSVVVVEHDLVDDVPINVVPERFNDTELGEGESFTKSIDYLRKLFENKRGIAVEKIIEINFETINASLDQLEYSAHDIKFGEKFTASYENVLLFLSVVRNDKVDNVVIKEKMLRILGSSVRNNDKALQNVLDLNRHNNQLFTALIDLINAELSQRTEKVYRDQILVKRVVSLFNALIYDPTGLAYFEQLNVRAFLNSRFPAFSDAVKERCLDLFNDFDMLVKDRDLGSDEL